MRNGIAELIRTITTILLTLGLSGGFVTGIIVGNESYIFDWWSAIIIWVLSFGIMFINALFLYGFAEIINLLHSIYDNTKPNMKEENVIQEVKAE